MEKLFHWNITKETALTLLGGILMIALSLLMIPFQSSSIFDETMSFLLRDVLMIFGLGVLFVTLYCEKKGGSTWRELGFRKDKLKISLLVNFILAVLLLLMFAKDGVPSDLFCLKNLYGATYILVAGIFEMLFIYGFLRMGFQNSFGIIPSILLTSAFYSFHHAGFQPEFFHLFFVGIMYVTVYYFTQNILIIFPFFWGIGALWDVLVDSSSGNEIKNFSSFGFAILILSATLIWIVILRIRSSKQRSELTPGGNHAFKNIHCDTGNACQRESERI